MRILVVDDSLAMRRIITRFLTNAGFGCILDARDGRDALARLSAGRVDLIVSDLNMPGMNGMALLEQVKSDPETCGIPFVILTVEAIQATMNQALALGANAYIVKPVTEKLFIKEILKCLAPGA